MIKLLKRKLQLLKNFLERLRSKPIETIKLTLYALMIKQFYKSFAWIITVMIFGPSFFDENPMESIKTIFNWMLDNLTITFSFILVKAQNFFNDLIRYFTNWDIPNVENPKMPKKPAPVERNNDQVSPITVKREDPETFKSYRKSWEKTTSAYSNVENSTNNNWTYFIIGTIIVGVVIGGTYYSWDTVSTIIPSAASTIWQNIKIFKSFIWKSGDNSESSTPSEEGSTIIIKPEEPTFHEEITITDNRTLDKSPLSRTMSQEELSEVNPTHEFQSMNIDNSSESSTDSSSSSSSGITIKNFKNRLSKYFTEEPWTTSNNTDTGKNSKVDDDLSDALPFSDLDTDLDPTDVELENPDIDTVLPDPKFCREISNNEVVPKNIIGWSYERLTNKGHPFKRYIYYGKVVFEDEDKNLFVYNPEYNDLNLLHTKDIPHGLDRLIRDSSNDEGSSNTDDEVGVIDWSGIPKIIVSNDDDSKTVTSEDINQSPQKLRKETIINDVSHLSPIPNYDIPKIVNARIVPLNEELPKSVKYGGIKPLPNSKGMILERMLVTDDKGLQQVIFKIPNKQAFFSWNSYTGKYLPLKEGKTHLNKVYNLITNNTE